MLTSRSLNSYSPNMSSLKTSFNVPFKSAEQPQKQNLNPVGQRFEKSMNVKILHTGTDFFDKKAYKKEKQEKNVVRNLILQCIAGGVIVTTAWLVGIAKIPKLIKKFKAKQAKKLVQEAQQEITK